MRIAIVSDIHGNLTAFEAVLADLRETAPDLILHGGDLADNGSSPVEVLDRIRDLGWPGVAGNTDEMLFHPEALREFARKSAPMRALLPVIEEIAAYTRDMLGPERLEWLRALPLRRVEGSVGLVHAGPETCWRAPGFDATGDELASVYTPLGCPIAVYGHIHHPFVRHLPGLTVANSGSVSLSYDGDSRAAYVLVDGSALEIRRVAYDTGREVRALAATATPHRDWIARILTTATPQMP